ncbi:hypothetical protein ACPXBI_28700, partial [Escherichia coli]|uniref:hypothetical protein n=1 Tax=Escherichia coli TaxID=562 RepID=UPI003CE4D089
MSGGNVARYRAGMGVVRHWGTGDRTSLVLSRESFLFARAISSATVQIDAVETEALALAHRHALVSVGTA